MHNTGVYMSGDQAELRVSFSNHTSYVVGSRMRADSDAIPLLVDAAQSGWRIPKYDGHCELELAATLLRIAAHLPACPARVDALFAVTSWLREVEQSERK